MRFISIYLLASLASKAHRDGRILFCVTSSGNGFGYAYFSYAFTLGLQLETLSMHR